MENEEQEPEGEQLTEVVRYLPYESALKTICSANLRLSFVRDFNDPFEFYCQDGALNKARSALLDYGISRVGLLCFSHRSTLVEPLMWSHYADHHRGVALRFRVSSDNCVLPAMTLPRIGRQGLLGLRTSNSDHYVKYRKHLFRRVSPGRR